MILKFLGGVNRVVKCANSGQLQSQGQCVLYLNALHFEDKIGHHRWDAGLIEHGVRDTLQQRLHWGHTMHHNTSAQEAVVKLQED